MTIMLTSDATTTSPDHGAPVSPVTRRAAPPLRVVATEQVRLTGLLLRGAGLLLLGLLILVVLVPVLSVTTAHDAAAARLAGTTNFTFTPAASLPMAFLALIVPLVVWRDEDPAQRDYHWMMPLQRRTHTLLRVFAGWAWTMVAASAYALSLAILPPIIAHLSGVSQPYHRGFAAWEWLVPFTATTIAYAFASAAAVGARRPFIWIFGTLAIYAGGVMFLLQQGMARQGAALMSAMNGRLGAQALIGVVPEGELAPDLGRWLGASALWGAGALLLLWLVASWRRDRR